MVVSIGSLGIFRCSALRHASTINICMSGLHKLHVNKMATSCSLECPSSVGLFSGGFSDLQLYFIDSSVKDVFFIHLDTQPKRIIPTTGATAAAAHVTPMTSGLFHVS